MKTKRGYGKQGLSPGYNHGNLLHNGTDDKWAGPESSLSKKKFPVILGNGGNTFEESF